ncbi:MAG: hypothetical protein QNJ41_10795 [Xenococcaceae cyanobacterium MO_188.B32]|nr:hypothetical protein [Xenococcaceae cyanobacterium MO_188.B32]
MRRIQKKLINSFSSLVRSSLRIVKISIKIITEFFIRGVKELVLEIALFGVGLGLTVIFNSLGLSNSLALGLSIVIVISICILSIRFFSPHKSRLARRKTLKTNQVRVRQEEKIANWIAQTLAQKSPKEWEEYQDWLHDILLDRFQMIDRGFPVWKVKMITYWRLTGFCVTVSLIKLRRLAVGFRA